MQVGDKEIIAQIKVGSQEAFRKLVERYQQFAFSLAFRILCNEDDAKDTVQDSFIKIWKNINSYKDNLKFTTWMYQIVTNTALDKLRMTKRNRHIDLNDTHKTMISSNNFKWETELENKELGNMIHLMADGLPEKQRMVFILRDIQDLPSSEVQQILNMSDTNLKSNLYHARKIIREKLSKMIAYERGLK